MVRCPNCDQETSGEYCQWCKYPLTGSLPRQEEVTVDKVVVKPTWALAWGLFWRYFLITLAIQAIIGGIIFTLVGTTVLPFIKNMWLF